MNKQELKILEKAYAIEIESALSKSELLFKSKSKTAKQLAFGGFLRPHKDGYLLTHIGRLAYCISVELPIG